MFRIAAVVAAALGRGALTAAVLTLLMATATGRARAAAVAPGRVPPSNERLEKMIADLGMNFLAVSPRPVGGGHGKRTATALRSEDCDAIAERCRAVGRVAPLLPVRRARFSYAGRSWVPLNFCGTTPSYLAVRDWENVQAGQMFSDRDVADAAMVCVLGQSAARGLFLGESPLGKEIAIEAVTFRVVGVLSRKGAGDIFLNIPDQDDIVLVPWTAVKKGRLDNADSPSDARRICVRPAKQDGAALATRQITELLRERHGIPAGEPDDFRIVDVGGRIRLTVENWRKEASGNPAARH
jgi:hypothetical protein